MKREREYGIDALRIVSMWMIVILHVLGHGGILKRLEWISFRYMTAWFLEAAAYGAVNCYGLISGYVGVESRPRYSSILFLWLQVVFYSTILAAAMHYIVPQNVAADEWVKFFSPVSFKLYWYYSAYFFISFLIPVINSALHAMNRRDLMVCLVAVLALVSANKTVFQMDTFMTGGGYSALWLLILYMMGGCIRLHGKELLGYQWIKRHAVLLYLIGTGAAWAVKVFMGNNSSPLILGHKVPTDILMSYVSPAIILSSVALFSLFAGWKPGKQACKWISVVSPTTFGVYLIHEHPQIRQHLIKDTFASFVHIKAYILPFAVLAAAAGIFSICIVIDLIRGKFFKWLKVKEGCRALMSRFGLS